MIYLRIKEVSRVIKKEGYIKKSIRFFLGIFIPKANPDYDDKINLVNYWLLEFEDKETIPNREIGLGVNEVVVVKMPYKNNYGYWVDNSLTFNDFKNSFEAVEITGEYFEEKWKVEPAK
jgi:hypothetical protein